MTQPDPPPGWPSAQPAGDWTAPGWAPPRRNAPAIASFFLGLLALPAVVFLAPGVILGLVALALGLVGRGRAKRREADTGGLATAGAVLGGVAVAASVAWGIVLALVDP